MNETSISMSNEWMNFWGILFIPYICVTFYCSIRSLKKNDWNICSLHPDWMNAVAGCEAAVRKHECIYTSISKYKSLWNFEHQKNCIRKNTHKHSNAFFFSSFQLEERERERAWGYQGLCMLMLDYINTFICQCYITSTHLYVNARLSVPLYVTVTLNCINAMSVLHYINTNLCYQCYNISTVTLCRCYTI